LFGFSGFNRFALHLSPPHPQRHEFGGGLQPCVFSPAPHAPVIEYTLTGQMARAKVV
jgi:hypothetical protein